MIRFLMYVFGKPYEPCKSCETLKQQLEIVNMEKADLLATIMSLVKPEVIQSSVKPTIVTPAAKKAMPWLQRQRILEQEDRARAVLNAQQKRSPGSPASVANNELNNKIEETEKELGLEEMRNAIS